MELSAEMTVELLLRGPLIGGSALWLALCWYYTIARVSCMMGVWLLFGSARFTARLPAVYHMTESS